jgi:hypothetical protein
MENVLIFYNHLDYFIDIWYNLWQLDIVCGHLVYFPHFGMFGPRKIWQPCSRDIPEKGISSVKTFEWAALYLYRLKKENFFSILLHKCAYVVTKEFSKNSPKMLPNIWQKNI